MIYHPHQFQLYAEKHVIDTPYCGLFMDMGLGKTVVTLSAIDKLIYGDMSVRKVLIIAPLFVAETVWIDELQKWDHLHHLRISLVLGSQKERLAALQSKSDIYVINRENVSWLVTYYSSAWPFDMVVIDESSSFKNHQAQRFKALRMVRPKMQRVVLLTGTPSPNGLVDLWSQMYLVDMGQRLGKTISFYRSEYLKPIKMNGPIVYKYGIRDDATKQLIYDKIGDVIKSMVAKDYLDLPERIEQIHKVKLNAELVKKYKQFEEDQVLQLLEENKEISAVNAAALVSKLLQFANGAIYLPEEYVNEKLQARKYVHIHDYKLDALADIIEAAQGEQVLVFYQFQHDRDRIAARFKAKTYSGRSDLEAWNRGEIGLLQAHPASVAYGLNMQAGGHIIVWFGTPYSLELWEQGNARLYRQGQEKPVILHQLACPGTIDMEAISAIKVKKTGQDALMRAVSAIVYRVKSKLNIA